MSKCTNCGVPTRREMLKDEIRLAGVTFTGTVPGWKCTACDESLYDGPGLSEFELAAASHLLARGVHTGEVLRFARKALGFTAADLGTLLGVRPETLSRWETDERAADARAVVLLGALVTDRLRGIDETAERLRAMQSPTRGPRRVDLDEVRAAIRAPDDNRDSRIRSGAKRVGRSASRA